MVLEKWTNGNRAWDGGEVVDGRLRESMRVHEWVQRSYLYVKVCALCRIYEGSHLLPIARYCLFICLFAEAVRLIIYGRIAMMVFWCWGCCAFDECVCVCVPLQFSFCHESFFFFFFLFVHVHSSLCDLAQEIWAIRQTVAILFTGATPLPDIHYKFGGADEPKKKGDEEHGSMWERERSQMHNMAVTWIRGRRKTNKIYIDHDFKRWRRKTESEKKSRSRSHRTETASFCQLNSAAWM